MSCEDTRRAHARTQARSVCVLTNTLGKKRKRYQYIQTLHLTNLPGKRKSLILWQNKPELQPLIGRSY